MHKHHRRKIGKCVNFQCPAYQRPVRKIEDAFKPTVPVFCPNERGPEPTKFDKGLKVCCVSKYVCAQTCGINFQECFDSFWNCAERICDQYPNQEREECLSTATNNDPRYLTKEKVLSYYLSMPEDKDICTHFHNLQRASCDCVPEKDLEDTLKERLVDFYRHHDPAQLTDKGKVKDKRFWKMWKGKRPEMFFNLMMKHPEKSYKSVNFSIAIPPKPPQPYTTTTPKKKKKTKKTRDADNFQKMEF